MNFSNLAKIVLVLIVYTAISTVNALNCYQCNSHENPECGDLHKHPPHKTAIFHQPCIDRDSSGNSSFCRIITYKFKFFKSADPLANRVIRSCGYVRSPKMCYQTDNDHHLETVCQCFGDGCNSATNLPIISSVALFAIGIVLHKF